MNRVQTVKGGHLGLLKTGGLRAVLDVNAYYMFIPMIMVICNFFWPRKNYLITEKDK